MKQVAALLVILAGLTLGAQCALAQAAKSQVERLYVIDCGTSVGPDKSRWTPGVDVGKPLDRDHRKGDKLIPTKASQCSL